MAGKKKNGTRKKKPPKLLNPNTRRLLEGIEAGGILPPKKPKRKKR